LQIDGVDCESVYNNTADLTAFSDAVLGTLTTIIDDEYPNDKGKVSWHIILLKCIDADATKASARRRMMELQMEDVPDGLISHSSRRRLASMPSFSALPEDCLCVFPFEYQGKSYGQCTYEGSRKPDKTWCMCGDCSWTGWDYCEKICATRNDMQLRVKAISTDRPKIIKVSKLFLEENAAGLEKYKGMIATALNKAYPNIPADTFKVRIKAGFAKVDLMKITPPIPAGKIDDGRSWMDRNWEKNVVMFAISVAAACLLFLIMCCLVDHCACHSSDRSQGLTGIVGGIFTGGPHAAVQRQDTLTEDKAE